MDCYMVNPEAIRLEHLISFLSLVCAGLPALYDVLAQERCKIYLERRDEFV
jgi:hypothetical protein